MPDYVKPSSRPLCNQISKDRYNCKARKRAISRAALHALQRRLLDKHREMDDKKQRESRYYGEAAAPAWRENRDWRISCNYTPELNIPDDIN